MPVSTLTLEDDVETAMAAITAESANRPVIVFKKSPICPVSFHAEREVNEWLETPGEGEYSYAEIDVIERKPLARGMMADLGITHESPQILIFRDGRLAWHTSHEGVTREEIAKAVTPT